MYFQRLIDPIIAIICYLKYKYKSSCCFNYAVAINEDNNIVIIVYCEVEVIKDRFVKLVFNFDNWVNIYELAKTLKNSVEITDYSLNQIKRTSQIINSNYLID